VAIPSLIFFLFENEVPDPSAETSLNTFQSVMSMTFTLGAIHLALGTTTTSDSRPQYHPTQFFDVGRNFLNYFFA